MHPRSCQGFYADLSDCVKPWFVYPKPLGFRVSFQDVFWQFLQDTGTQKADERHRRPAREPVQRYTWALALQGYKDFISLKASIIHSSLKVLCKFGTQIK